MVLPFLLRSNFMLFFLHSLLHSPRPMFILASLLYLFSSISLAETAEKKEYKYYDVEVILFKHNNLDAISSEYWEIIPPIEADIDANTLASSPVNPEKPRNITTNIASYLVSEKQFNPTDKRVSVIEKKQRILNKPSDHIRYSKDYLLLAHIAWKQPGFSKDEALPVDFIFSHKNSHISGNINIVLSRYLHTKVDFSLIEEVCRPDPEEVFPTQKDIDDKVKVEVKTTQQQLAKADKDLATTPQEQQIAEIPVNITCQTEKILFKQSRKMRSKQLHYIDHPVFGLLVQITPSAEHAIQVTATPPAAAMPNGVIKP